MSVYHREALTPNQTHQVEEDLQVVEGSHHLAEMDELHRSHAVALDSLPQGPAGTAGHPNVVTCAVGAKYGQEGVTAGSVYEPRDDVEHLDLRPNRLRRERRWRHDGGLGRRPRRLHAVAL